MNKPSWRFALICLLLAWLCSFSAFARPRPPLPPVPEAVPVWSRLDFDEPLRAGLGKAGALQAAYGDWVEGGSGYALRRGAASVQPLVPYLWPGVDGQGRTNFVGAGGALRFWFKPEWSSASAATGTGPGHHARLLELTVVGDKDALVIWSLNVSPDGTTLFFTGTGEAGALDLLQAPIDWQAGDWHLVALNYGPKNSALLLDGELVAVGGGVPAVPPALLKLSVGSTLAGSDAAEGEFDELCAFARPLAVAHARFYYEALRGTLALGPISTEEDALRRKAALQRRAAREGEPPPQMLRLLSSFACETGDPVVITNAVAWFDFGVGWTMTFDLVGGTNGLLYDIFTATSFAGTNFAATPWTWLERGLTCSTYQYTNQPAANAFYVVGTPLDADGDGLTDAYERLVSKTSPTVPDFIDSDGDGVGDFDELILGRNPNNPGSVGAPHDVDVVRLEGIIRRR